MQRKCVSVCIVSETVAASQESRTELSWPCTVFPASGQGVFLTLSGIERAASWPREVLWSSEQCCTGIFSCSLSVRFFFTNLGGHVAQLAERRTGTPPTKVRFPGAAREIFPPSPESTFSADSLTVSVHPRVQSHEFTSVCT